MSRYKSVGWRNDSYRHSLAARGIRSAFTIWRATKPKRSELSDLTGAENMRKARLEKKAEIQNMKALLKDPSRKEEDSIEKNKDGEEEIKDDKGEILGKSPSVSEQRKIVREFRYGLNKTPGYKKYHRRL